MAPSKIPQVNPKALYLARRKDIDEALARVLASGWYIMGEEVRGFEVEFANYLGAENAVGVASGTDAIELSLRALGVGPGDDVVTVSHTAVATVAAIERAGATPVLVDIDEETFTMSPASLEAALAGSERTRRPKAIVVVHLYGHPADMPAILELSHAYGLPVVEDCAQAHGARLNGQAVGTYGDLAAFSFYPTKNLPALGDAGMVVTNRDELATRVRRLTQYGWEPRFVSQEPGVNSRLDELQAAVLRVNLEHLERDNARRREIAETYGQRLPADELALPHARSEVNHVYHQYVLKTPSRDALKTHLAVSGIGSAVHYPLAVHQQPAYAGRVPCFDRLEVTERIGREILSLPMNPWLSSDEVGKICSVVDAWAQDRS